MADTFFGVFGDNFITQGIWIVLMIVALLIPLLLSLAYLTYAER